MIFKIIAGSIRQRLIDRRRPKQPSISTWEAVFLQSRVNGGEPSIKADDSIKTVFRWPQGTPFQRRYQQQRGNHARTNR